MNNRDISILVVDDEESIAGFIKMGLEAEGFRVLTAGDGNTALMMARENRPQIVILDIMMPGMDGFEVCYEIKRNMKAAIIMLTARDEVDDRVRGLNLGADDYMSKPFSFKELLARIHARLRNMNVLDEKVLEFGPFRIDDSGHIITYREKKLALSPTEYNLLRLLVSNNGRVLSKTAIIESVWGYDFSGDDNIVEVYIRYLRDKIGDREHKVISTVRGVGYKVVIQ